MLGFVVTCGFDFVCGGLCLIVCYELADWLRVCVVGLVFVACV